jgi:hypothetical protein
MSRPLSCVLLLIFGLAAPSAAQVHRATLTGRIVDASGAALPDAAVEISSPRTGLVRRVASDSTGSYRASELPNDTYVVTVARDALQTAIVTDVRLEVGQVRVLDVVMEVGSVTAEVQVVAEATVLDTRTAEVGAAVTNRQIQAIPLNGRNGPR